MKITSLHHFVCLGLLMTLCDASAASFTVIVPGTSDPWLAGMPNGSRASFCGNWDVAPDQSPAAVIGIAIEPGQSFIFSATGAVSQLPDEGTPLSPPDGKNPLTDHTAGAENGIADVRAPYDSLIGIFLGLDDADVTPAPSKLDFSSSESRDYVELSPRLKQPFFVGDGRTSSGQIQSVKVPQGAARLYLGVMDSCGWNDNRGSFTVQIEAGPWVSIRVSQVEVCWSSATNRVYQVQYRSDLTTNMWVDFGKPTPGSGSTNCITDAVTSPRRFYRVVVLP